MTEIDPMNRPGDKSCALARVLSCLQSPVLLLLRVAFGYQFMLTGWGKLSNIEAPTAFFAKLGIPFPHANAYLAGSTECFGGLLLLLGLASRIVSIPLTFVMLVAYATAGRPEIVAVFSPTPDPKTHQIDALSDRIVAVFSYTAFPFLCAVLVVLAFGPGKISLDYLIKRMRKKPITIDMNPVRP